MLPKTQPRFSNPPDRPLKSYRFSFGEYVINHKELRKVFKYGFPSERSSMVKTPISKRIWKGVRFDANIIIRMYRFKQIRGLKSINAVLEEIWFFYLKKNPILRKQLRESSQYETDSYKAIDKKEKII